jgi:hypothetical protein
MVYIKQDIPHVPMMTFPNEILALILQDVCQLDDDEFEFAHRFHSKPHITATRIAALLVCRRWQHVASSPLYRTIILSTAAQARCLARTLGDHPDLGSYVRKLLFNGGYGAAARKILQAVPRITHLCLSLAIPSSDSVRGLCEALQCIQPRSVRLNDSHNAYNNMHTQALVASICSCIKGKWTELIEFRFPYDISRRWKVKEANKRHLLDAMYNAPLLKIVHMPAPYNLDVLLPLLRKSSLLSIYSETPFGLHEGYHVRVTSYRLPLCCKIHFPLPGPWAPACRPYGPLQADSK